MKCNGKEKQKMQISSDDRKKLQNLRKWLSVTVII